MAKFSLKGSTVTINGTASCVESGDVDFGELNMVETTCSTDMVKTYVPGTFANASGSVTVNETSAVAAWLTAFGGDNDPAPEPYTIAFSWGTGTSATFSVSGFITNVTAPIASDQALSVTFSFTGTGAVTA